MRGLGKRFGDLIAVRGIDLDVSENNVNSGEHHFFDFDGDGDTDLLWAVFGPQATLADKELKSYVAAFLQK